MAAPTLWIILPAVLAVVLFLLNRFRQLVRVTGTMGAALLAWLAWRLPIDAPVEIGAFSFKLSEVLTILGRSFILEDPDRPLLGLIYLLAALWFALSWMVEPGPLFVPVGLGMVTLLTGALAVDPFLYAALFLEIATLLSVPLLNQPGRAVGRGVLRFLTYQTLGMPFILFTGWMLAGLEASPGDVELVVRASVLLGMGFAFLLAVFPFHAWVPMLLEEASPYVVSYLYLMLFLLVPLFGISFLDRFVWLRDAPQLYRLMQWIGLATVSLGGLWVAFERRPRRIFGYAVLVEIGLGLLAISLGIRQGVPLFFELIPPRAAYFLIWSVALSIVHTQGQDLNLASLSGLGRRVPALAAGLLAAHLAAIGFPTFAGFPPRFDLVAALAGRGPGVTLISFVGSVGLTVAFFRTLRALFDEDEPGQASPAMTLGQRVFMLIGAGTLVFMGLFHSLLLPYIQDLAGFFSALSP